MSNLVEAKGKWKSLILLSIAIVLLSLMPQIHFWILRGSDWNGAYVVLYGDEFLYSTYINALIDGRPRRTDPFAGRDDHQAAPLPESLFSIQFVPSYTIAYMARIFGMSASTAFIVLAGLTGLFASASVFWLLSSAIVNKTYVAAGVVAVLCLGTAVGGEGLMALFTRPQATFMGLPFLRRYEPALPFPLFFVFCTLTWRAVTTKTKSTSTLNSFLAGVALVLLIYSYFYLWTAAAAWFFGLTLLWVVFRRQDWRAVVRLILIVGIQMAIALIVYFNLIRKLPVTSHDAQVLLFTHKPDLIRIPEILATVTLIALILLMRARKSSLSDPRLLLTLSFTLLPFLVFNQQVISGRSIQPYHYEIFIANYAVLVGLVLTINFFCPNLRWRHMILAVVVCFLWGAVEMNITFIARSDLDPVNDEMVPIFQSLKRRAQYDGTWDGLRSKGVTGNTVFSPDIGVSRLLPTWAPQRPLLTVGSASFQSLSDEERKENLFAHLYYCGATASDLRELLNGRTGDGFLIRYARSTLFGPERVLPALGLVHKPITETEIEENVEDFGRFENAFSYDKASKYSITYVIVPERNDFDSSRLNLWYDQYGAERVGKYDLYLVRLRAR